MPREPFTRDQLAFIEARALDALRAWGRALKHLNRIGAGGHELSRVIRAAHHAEHDLRVHAMYAKHEAEKRGARRDIDRIPHEGVSRRTCPPAKGTRVPDGAAPDP